MNVVLGADIHTHGRTVENQYIRLAGQPFRQHNTLLISAGQGGSRVVRIGSGNGQLLHPPVNLFLILLFVQQALIGQIVNLRYGNVVANTLIQE